LVSIDLQQSSSEASQPASFVRSLPPEQGRKIPDELVRTYIYVHGSTDALTNTLTAEDVQLQPMAANTTAIS
jgi:hypothetical protein